MFIDFLYVQEVVLFLTKVEYAGGVLDHSCTKQWTKIKNVPMKYSINLLYKILQCVYYVKCFFGGGAQNCLTLCILIYLFCFTIYMCNCFRFKKCLNKNVYHKSSPLMILVNRTILELLTPHAVCLTFFILTE